MPQRRPFTVGTHLREGRHGRTGADAATVLVAGETDSTSTAGECWGDPRRVQRQPPGARRADVLRRARAPAAASCSSRRDRASRPARPTRPPCVFAVLRRSDSTSSPRDSTTISARGRAHPRLASTGRAERLGGRLLRSRPRPAPADSSTWPPRSASSGSCSTTAGSATAATTPPVSATGRVSEAVWGDGRLRTSSWHAVKRSRDAVRALVRARDDQPRLRARACPPGVDHAGTRAAARRVPPPAGARPDAPGAFAHVRDSIVDLVQRVRHRLHQVGSQPRPHRRRLDPDGSRRSARADARRVPAPRRDPRRVPRPRDRVVLVRRRPRRPRTSSSTPTGCGHRTRSTRTSGSRSSGGRPSCCRPSWWAATSAPIARTPPGAVSTSRSVPPPPLFGHFGIEWDLTEATAAGARRARRVDRLLQAACARSSTPAASSAARWKTATCGCTGAVAPDRREALYLVTLRERHITWPVGAGAPARAGSRPRRTGCRPAGPEHAHAAFDPRVHPEWWRDGVVVSGAVPRRGRRADSRAQPRPAPLSSTWRSRR